MLNYSVIVHPRPRAGGRWRLSAASRPVGRRRRGPAGPRAGAYYSDYMITRLYHVISCHVISYHIISYYGLLYHIII